MANLIRFSFCLSALVFSQAALAAPEVRAVSIRGLQIDGTTTIRIDGSGLMPRPELVLSVPIAKQTLKPGATATRVEFDVVLKGDVEPGLYNLWLASAEGVSNPTVIAADRLPQRPFADKIESLPIALHGAVGGSARLRTSFTGKANQAVIIEVEAKRLGGKLRPVLHIFDASNQQLDWAMPSPTLRGDTRLTFTPPADGTYTIELHDLQYAAPAPNFFRLKVGNWQYADQVFPPAVVKGSSAQLQLIGGVPADKQIPFAAKNPLNRGLSKAAPWLDNSQSSGFRPAVVVSEFPEAVEQPAGEKLQQLPGIPSAVSGRLLAAGEQDKFQIAVQPGAKLRFEVFADRIGSPVDTILDILNEQGGRLTGNDDAGSPDSRVDYTVPANVKTLVLAIRDSNGRSGPRCIYRAVVRPIPGSGGRPDFRLRLDSQRQSVAAGDRLILKVIAEREQYSGPIQLRFDSLPEGVQVQGSTIAAGANATLLTIHGSGTNLAHALTTLRGFATVGERTIERIARVDSHALIGMQPWLSHEIGIAMTSPSPSGFKVNWGSVGIDTKMVLGGKLDIPVASIRPPGFDGPVRLILETNQLPVKNGNNVDANRTIRSETNQPIEIAADANAQKAWDARNAVVKVLADAKAAQTTVAENGRKAIAAADTKLKQAMSRFTAMKDTATKAAAAAKTAGDADAAAQKALTASLAQVKSAVDATGKAENSKLAETARAAAAAATALQKTAQQKAVTGKALADASAKAKQTADAVVVAETAVATAQAELKTANDAATKANQTEDAKVKDATGKLAAAEQASRNASALANNDGTFSIFVPSSLAENAYEFALRAELLSRDKKSVVARTYTPVRRFSTMIPIEVALAVPAQFKGEIDPKAGATIVVPGKVTRLAGMNQDVTVTLVGLPGGVTVPKVVVKPDQSDFQLSVAFPANFKPAELKNIRLVATGKMRPKAPIDVRSKEVPFDIQLTAKVAEKK